MKSYTREDFAGAVTETEIGLREEPGSQVLQEQREHASSHTDDLMLPQSRNGVLAAHALGISLPSKTTPGCNMGDM